jgi:hypothetical protein
MSTAPRRQGKYDNYKNIVIHVQTETDFVTANRRISHEVLWTILKSTFPVPDVIGEDGSADSETEEIKNAYIQATRSEAGFFCCC